jgi:putative tryptophan/tyrosine transport system substrate-binding protein
MLRIGIVSLATTILAGLALVAASAGGGAQTAKKSIRVGVITFSDRELNTHLERSLSEGFRQKGYVEGVNLILERRNADGHAERVPGIVKEFAGMKLDAILTTCTPTTRAMASVPNQTPIVMAAVSDPLGQGLIASYPHPGGRITGTASQFQDLAPKLFQLLRETAPNAGTIGVLLNPRNPVHKIFLADIEAAAQTLGAKVATFEVGQPAHLDTAFDGMREAGIDAVMVLPDDSFLFQVRRRIVERLAAAKLPSIFGLREAVEDGALMSYGENLRLSHFRAAYFVDQIVQGTKPANLPVEQPTRFELVVNLKAAKALGIPVPTSILLRADEVIE